MEIIKYTKEKHRQIVEKAALVLKQGGLVVYPTETCYGAGVDATSTKAVEKLLKYKSKRNNKPLSIAVCDKQMATEYIHLNSTAENIYDNFLPGPITVVSKGKQKVAKGVESPLKTLGIRIPDYALVLEIVKLFKKPISATSANASYKKNPYAINDILENISQKQEKLLDLLIDVGTLPKKKPSVVVDATLDDVKILRQGDLSLDGYKTIIAKGENQSEKFAATICQQIKKYIGKKLIVIALQGELGTGKTYFTKFLGKNLQVSQNILSPTFVLCNEYKIPNISSTFFHIDAYRFLEPQEIDQLNPQLFQRPNLVVIEWSDKVREYIQKYLDKESILVEIRLEHYQQNSRKIQYRIDC